MGRTPAGLGALPDRVLEAVRAGTDWDVAIRYHELKAILGPGEAATRARDTSVDAVLRRARGLMGAAAHPSVRRSLPASALEQQGRLLDLDLEETLEEAPFLGSGAAVPEDALWFEVDMPRQQPVVLAVDTSLSMTGEKLALTAVALAVVLLQFPEDPLGIVAFESKAVVLKRPSERLGLRALMERFLDVPAQGYTHLEDGLKRSLGVMEDARIRAGGRPPAVVLLSDGKYTAGKDPAYLADRFPKLIVLKMGPEKASLGLCRELATRGSGFLQEVPDLKTLPQAMVGVVRGLLRGAAG